MPNYRTIVLILLSLSPVFIFVVAYFLQISPLELPNAIVLALTMTIILISIILVWDMQKKLYEKHRLCQFLISRAESDTLAFIKQGKDTIRAEILAYHQQGDILKQKPQGENIISEDKINDNESALVRDHSPLPESESLTMSKTLPYRMDQIIDKLKQSDSLQINTLPIVELTHGEPVVSQIQAQLRMSLDEIVNLDLLWHMSSTNFSAQKVNAKYADQLALILLRIFMKLNQNYKVNHEIMITLPKVLCQSVLWEKIWIKIQPFVQKMSANLTWQLDSTWLLKHNDVEQKWLQRILADKAQICMDWRPHVHPDLIDINPALLMVARIRYIRVDCVQFMALQQNENTAKSLIKLTKRLNKYGIEWLISDVQPSITKQELRNIGIAFATIAHSA